MLEETIINRDGGDPWVGIRKIRIGNLRCISAALLKEYTGRHQEDTGVPEGSICNELLCGHRIRFLMECAYRIAI